MLHLNHFTGALEANVLCATNLANVQACVE